MTETVTTDPAADPGGRDARRGRQSEVTAAAASRGLMFVAALLIIVPAAIGLLVLRSGAVPPPPGAEVEAFNPSLAGDNHPDDITSADLLQPANEATGRIRYQFEGGSGNLANGGAIELHDGMLLRVSVSPFPPSEFDTDVALLLADATGDPVTNATIAAEWDMVMAHGPFSTTFEHTGGGSYRAETFDFFMYGPWQLETTVTTPTGSTTVRLAIFVWPE